MTAKNIKTNKIESGFTLIELLVVIGILAILLAITLIAINPARQFGQANDTKRKSAATQLLNAIGAYMADHGGTYPTALADSSNGDICAGAACPAGSVDLCSSLLPNYMPALPMDPDFANSADILSCAGDYDTGYNVQRAGGRITVSNNHSTIGNTISVSR